MHGAFKVNVDAAFDEDSLVASLAVVVRDASGQVALSAASRRGHVHYHFTCWNSGFAIWFTEAA